MKNPPSKNNSIEISKKHPVKTAFLDFQRNKKLNRIFPQQVGDNIEEYLHSQVSGEKVYYNMQNNHTIQINTDYMH